jgi:hypothetical protein
MCIFLLLKLQVRRSEEKELVRRRMVIASTNPHYKEITIRKRIASMYIFLPTLYLSCFVYVAREIIMQMSVEVSIHSWL